jgi:hypothetical protein
VIAGVLGIVAARGHDAGPATPAAVGSPA